MSTTSFTALIITMNDLSAISTVIIAILLSGLCYFLFLRKRAHRLRNFIVAFLLSAVIGWYCSARLYLHRPIAFELVRAGQ